MIFATAFNFIQNSLESRWKVVGQNYFSTNHTKLKNKCILNGSRASNPGSNGESSQWDFEIYPLMKKNKENTVHESCATEIAITHKYPCTLLALSVPNNIPTC